MPRNESTSGKRGLPGGGATAGDGAAPDGCRVWTTTAGQSRSQPITRSISPSGNASRQSRLQLTALPRARSS